MSLKTHKWRFTASLVADAPDNRGLYALWRHDEMICLGRANGGRDTIRARLLEHLAGHAGAESRQATHYSWELCANPAAREAEILADLPRTAWGSASNDAATPGGSEEALGSA